jgi:uncharacterized protein YndB with AHSA1/START domain
VLKKILLGVVGVLLLLVLVIATRPNSFEVKRSATIQAPPDRVYAQLNDFHRWLQWSPWDKLDPTMQRTHSGPTSGVGAHYHWIGNKDVGTGEMTIVKSTPDQSVEIDLHFIEPFEAKNVTLFTLSPTATGTQVEWKMTGENNFVGKAFSLFMDMDSMVGKDFESGLSNLAQVAVAAQ